MAVMFTLIVPNDKQVERKDRLLREHVVREQAGVTVQTCLSEL